MIGLYDFMMAINRYQRGNLRKDDAKILWAGITTAGNSGADISRGDYATAMTQAYNELETQLADGHDVDDMIDWTSQQDWCRVGLKEFEVWISHSNK